MANLEKDLPVRFTDGPLPMTFGKEVRLARTPPYTFYIYEESSPQTDDIQDLLEDAGELIAADENQT
jgi:hypothetical protein